MTFINLFSLHVVSYQRFFLLACLSSNVFSWSAKQCTEKVATHRPSVLK